MDTDEAAAAPASTGETVPAPAAVKEDVGPYTLDNPVRVVPAQAKFITIKPDSR